jgi:BRCA1-associated protein
MVCVLAVPSSLSVADFCQFAAALIPRVVEMRMVKSVDGAQASTSSDEGGDGGSSGGAGGHHGQTLRGGGGSGGGGVDGGGAGAGGGGTHSGGKDNGAGTYSVILRFEDQDAADSFALNYHNRRFNSFVEGTCRVLFVRSIELTPAVSRTSKRGGGETKVAGSIPSGGGETTVLDTKAASAASADGVAFASAIAPPLPSPPPPDGMTELPSCPVCLDRLDQDVSGVVTTICSHSFHASCLSKWGDSSCPVCRYTQAPEAEVHCHQCGSSANLWVCLICGYVGCGRYAQRHAVEHWKESDHCYSLELGTQRVWDHIHPAL